MLSPRDTSRGATPAQRQPPQTETPGTPQQRQTPPSKTSTNSLHNHIMGLFGPKVSLASKQDFVDPIALNQAPPSLGVELEELPAVGLN